MQIESWQHSEHSNKKFSKWLQNGILSLIPPLHPPSSLHRKKSSGWISVLGPEQETLAAICRLLIISVQTLLLTSASVFLLQGEFSNPCWKCFSTGTAQAWNWLESLSPVHSVPLLPRVPESWRKRNLQGNSKMLCMSGSYRLTWSLDVHSWITSLSILWSSVNFDGIFPQFQKLEKLVFRPLLQSHQGSCLLLQVLIYGKNDLSSLLCFLVPGVFEEPLQCFLVYVFEDVAHSFLTWGCVEVVAVDGWADSQRGGHAEGRLAWLGFHGWEILREFSSQALQRVCSKIILGLLFKVWTKLQAQITVVTSEWSQGSIIADQFNSWVAKILFLCPVTERCVQQRGRSEEGSSF